MVTPFRKNESWIARMRASGSDTIAVPWTVIVTGIKNSTISQAPRRGERLVAIIAAPRSSTTAEIITQKARNGIAAGDEVRLTPSAVHLFDAQGHRVQ